MAFAKDVESGRLCCSIGASCHTEIIIQPVSRMGALLVLDFPDRDDAVSRAKLC